MFTHSVRFTVTETTALGNNIVVFVHCRVTLPVVVLSSVLLTAALIKACFEISLIFLTAALLKVCFDISLIWLTMLR